MLDLSQDALNRPIPSAIQRTNSLVSRSLGSDCSRSVHREIVLQHRWIDWFARSEHVLALASRWRSYKLLQTQCELLDVFAGAVDPAGDYVGTDM